MVQEKFIFEEQHVPNWKAPTFMTFFIIIYQRGRNNKFLIIRVLGNSMIDILWNAAFERWLGALISAYMPTLKTLFWTVLEKKAKT